MRAYMYRVGFWVAVALLGLSACLPEESVAPSQNNLSLVAVVWVLETLKDLPASADHTVTLDLEDGQVSGNASCNTYSGTYAEADASLTFSDVITTLIACDTEQEFDYMQALNEVRSYSIQGIRLSLLNEAGDTLMTFTPLSNAALENGKWRVLDYYQRTPPAVITPLLATELTLSFASGNIIGFAGCNQFFARYTQEGYNVNIREIGSTRKACAEDISAQEQHFFKLLTEARVFEIQGDELALFDITGQRIIRFIEQAGSP